MSKREAETDETFETTLKSGQRPTDGAHDSDGDDAEFEDQYEDEFESEDEIIEAGVDGRPDDEREAEEKEGTPVCSYVLSYTNPQSRRCRGRQSHFYSRENKIVCR